MRNARLLETLLAAAAVAVATWPVETLVEGRDWVVAVAIGVGLVALTGLLLRAARTPAWLVVAVQLLVVLLSTTLLHGLGSGPFGLPGLDLLDRLVGGLQEAGRTIRSYAAPAPGTRGLVLLVGLLTSLVAVVVDHLTVARRSATLAGFPLLVVYLVSVVNTPGALHPRYFLAVALLWLLLLVEQHHARLRRWSTLRPGPRTRLDAAHHAVDRFTARGRVLALLAVAVAVAGQLALLDDVPTRFLADGLGRQSRTGGGTLAFTSEVDIARSLGSRDPSPVLTYTLEGDSAPPPLGVTLAKDYAGGRWRMVSSPTPGTGGPARPAGATDLPLPHGISSALPHRRASISVSENSAMRPPQLPVPGPVLGMTIDSPWHRDDETGLVSVARHVPTYSVRYAVPTLTPEQLGAARRGPEDEAVDAYLDPAYLAVDPESQELVRTLADEAKAEARGRYGPPDSPYHTAMAIQQHLRSGRYTYSLTLAPLTDEERAAGARQDALSHFVHTKVGYCTQFSTAMVMMARSEGIPARVVFGFLPGAQQPDGEYLVRAADAHAWPELYLDGVGWTRFEPTPGARSGLPPAWAMPSERDTPTTSAAPTTTTTAAARPSAESTTAARGAGSGQEGLLNRFLGWFTPLRFALLLTLLVLVAAVAATPLRARAVHRARLQRARTPAQAVEAHWTTLSEQLDDLGMGPPTGLTPRMLRAHYDDDRSGMPVEGRRALARLLGAVERARYAPPGASASPTQVEADARTVRRSAASSRRRRRRLRAALLPSTARRQP